MVKRLHFWKFNRQRSFVIRCCRTFMAGPILSSDGKWMWNDESRTWIPSPPSHDNTPKSNLDMSLFPGWDKKSVTDLLEQGWTVNQLKSYYSEHVSKNISNTMTSPSVQSKPEVSPISPLAEFANKTPGRLGNDRFLPNDPRNSKYGVCGHCNVRPKTTGIGVARVRGYLLMYSISESFAVGCPTCVRIFLLKETFWNALFGWWSPIAFLANCIVIPGNLITSIFVRDNTKQLLAITQKIIVNSE